MKFIHLADLHIDKKMFGYSLAAEQRDVLQQVLDAADQFEVDGILIAGDVYDTAVPNVEAVGILDWFLEELHKRQLPVFMISGNHDSAGRLGFGRGLFEDAGIHIAGSYEGFIPYYDLKKEDETVRIHLLPFIRPAIIRAVEQDETCRDWTQAAKIALDKAQLLDDGVNILVSHQFYAGGKVSESEQHSIGNLDQIDVSVLEPFDYAALGHLHAPQHVREERFRYSGTLLKFSAPEIDAQKSFTLLETGKNGIQITEIPVRAKNDFIRIQGRFDDLVHPDSAPQWTPDCYSYIVLEDEMEQPDAFRKLQNRFSRVLKVEYSRSLPQTSQEEFTALSQTMKDPMEIVQEFYEKQNGYPIREDMLELCQTLWEDIHETD